MDEKDFSGGSVGASYKKFGIEISAGSDKGTSIVLEKTAENQVEVTVGPTQGFTTGGEIKFKPVDGVEGSVGQTYTNESAHYKKFTVDTSSEEGKQVFDNVMSKGELPDNDGNGVSNYHEVRTTSGQWNNTWSVKLPGLEFGGDRRDGMSNTTVTSYPDGRTEYQSTYDLDGDGKPEATEVRTSTDGGKTWGEPSLIIRHTVPSDKTQLEHARRVTGRDDLQPGDVVEIKLSRSEVDELRKSGYTYGEKPGDNQETAINKRGDYLMSRSQDPLQSLEQDNNRIGKASQEKPLPGEVTVHKKAPEPPQNPGGHGGGGGGGW